VSAEEADHHAVDEELGGGEKIGVARVFGAEKGATALDEETLEGGLAVDEGGDDVVRAGFAGGEEDDVVFDDVGADHGIAADAEGEEAGIGAEAEGGGIDGDRALGLLFIGRGEAGRDHAVERDAQEWRVAGMVAGVEEAAGFAGEAVKGALLGERIDVALDGEGAREAKVFLDFAERGGDAVLPLGGLDKIEDLLLAFSEGFAHGVFT
jgi:hypothetical protein